MITLAPIVKNPSSTKHQLEQWSFDYIDTKLRTEDPKQLLAELTRIKLVIDLMDARVREEVKWELQGEKGEYFGCNIGFQKGRTTWNYEADPEWMELRSQVKNREKFLQELEAPIVGVDQTTGEEIIYAVPAVKSVGETNITVKLT